MILSLRTEENKSTICGLSAAIAIRGFDGGGSSQMKRSLARLDPPFTRDGFACLTKLDFVNINSSESLDAEILRILCEGLQESSRSTSAGSSSASDSSSSSSAESDSSRSAKSKKIRLAAQGFIRVISDRRRGPYSSPPAPSSGSRRGPLSRKMAASQASAAHNTISSTPVTPASSTSTSAPEKARCLKCGTGDTPQWRYIHTGRYCNACYMRVKRWVDNNLHGRKLPSRVKADITAEDDERLAAEAADIVALAFSSLEQAKL